MSGRVTPYAGVWIEIAKDVVNNAIHMSLPTRECGLKYMRIMEKRLICWSLPTRECGLKFGRYVADGHIRSHSLRGSVD